ncbi:MAG TPA: DNA polymerase III subunit alpha, partial [Ktedonobacterales bacterium]|nr:DNA polymerase III subunit alpha [Ktedonobacterales bacterium]
TQQPIHKLIEMARDLEGTVRSTGIHAAGVVISREPLDTVVPLQLRDYKEENPWLVSQYEQAHLEELGLLKFDFLGLSNLTILMNCQKFIRQTRGIEVDLDRLPTEDARTYALLAQGETTGIFQLESGAMRRYIQELKPTCIEDVTAMVALYRPGPMDSIPTFIKSKHGEIEVKYLHPRLEPLLRESYGVIVYQDQVLLIAVQLAGFTWGEVDKFRKAMSKKIPEELNKYRDKFIKGCVQNGIDEKIAEQIFTFIEPFAGYGFNKSHAAAYGFVAYQTAYLKANYTAEFMAATLTTESGDAKKVVAAIDECRRMGVEVRPPDINKSESGFTVEVMESDLETGEPRWAVRFGLLAIKNVGSRPIDALLEARKEGGPFRSLADVFARTDSKSVTRSAVECLIKAGALDSLGRRSQLLAALDRALSYGQPQRKMRAIGQNSLFGALSDDNHDDFTLPDVPDHPQEQVLQWEKELLNLYLSAHPLSHIAPALKRRVTTYTANLNEEWAGQKITLGGRITEIRRIVTKRGDTMLIVQLEDLQGTVPVTVFPKTYAATSDVWHEDAVVLVTGTVRLRDEDPEIICESAEEFAMPPDEAERKEYLVRISFRRQRNSVLDVAHLQDVLTALNDFPGHDRYEFLIRNGKWEARLTVPPGHAGIRYCPELHQQLEGILGPNTVQPQYAN